MNDRELTKLAKYIADYVNEELSRGRVHSIDWFLIRDAIDAYKGGAGDE